MGSPQPQETEFIDIKIEPKIEPIEALEPKIEAIQATNDPIQAKLEAVLPKIELIQPHNEATHPPSIWASNLHLALATIVMKID